MARIADRGRKRLTRPRLALPSLLLALTVLAVDRQRAGADVDLTGTWASVQFDMGPPNPIVCSSVQVEQTGTALTMDAVFLSCVGGLIGSPGSLLVSGSIDPVTGVFTVSGVVSPNCTTLSFTATAAAHGNSFTGSGVCTGSFGSTSVFVHGYRNLICGDGVVTPFEECDDGNSEDDDCCADCLAAAPGSPCASDGNPCTSDQCNASASCEHDPQAAGLACDSDANPCTLDICDGAGGCTHEGPRADCRSGAKSLLLLKNQSDDGKDRLTWKWLKGELALAELGAPPDTTDYALCLYAGTTGVRIDLPAGSSWQAAGSRGFTYKDASGAIDGARKAVLKSGAAGKAKALVKGKGSNLPDDLAPGLELPVTAQLVNDENAVCLESVYDAPDVLRNDERIFKAKTP